MARQLSTAAHESILDAALKLFSERGIDATSMDAIAEESGVSKATIYNHWKAKDSLCLDVLARLHEIDTRPVFNTGDFRADLIAVLSYKPSKEVAEQQRRMMPHLMTYAARHRVFGDAWRARVLEPPRRQIRELLERGVRERVFMPGLNLDLSVALLFGPMIFSYVVSGAKGSFQPTKEFPENFPELVVDAFLRAHETSQQPKRTKKHA